MRNEMQFGTHLKGQRQQGDLFENVLVICYSTLDHVMGLSNVKHTVIGQTRKGQQITLSHNDGPLQYSTCMVTNTNSSIQISGRQMEWGI